MAFQIVINILIAIIWMFLGETYTLPSFVMGYTIGLLLILMLQRFIPDEFYLRKVYKILALIFLFLKELTLSNLSILKLIYKPKLDIKPGIFELPTELKSNWEITLLANLITLTPGTLSVAVSNDQSKIYIHAMDIPDVQKSINEIKESFERAIMEVTR
ncbi:Na+/H+ antiporter subunit E [Bacillaceae bacterium S4-13-58]